MKKSVIVLGAGASVESGIPAQNNFIDEAIKIVLSTKNEFKSTFFYLNILHNFRHNFYHTTSIEELFNAAEVLTDFPFLDLNVITNPKDGIMQTGNLRPARYIQEAIQFLIVIALKKKLEKTNHQGRNSYKTLLQKFDGPIITFNWDNIVEQVCKSISKPYDIFQTEEDVKLKLVKLHGSIDWYYDQENENNKIIIDSDLSQKTVWELNYDYKQPFLSPLIIFPNMSKPAQLDQFGNLMYTLWDSAQKFLSTAERIYFIGYSLPTTDLDANILLQYSICNNPNQELELIIVDPFLDDHLKSRYTSLKNSSKNSINIKFECVKFSEFIQDSKNIFD